MRIEDLKPGQHVTLIARVKNESATFESTVREVSRRQHTVTVDAIIHGGKPVSFRGKGVMLDVVASAANEKPHLFRNVSCTLFKKKDNKLYYTLSTIAESAIYNRRKNARCYIGLPTSLRFGPNRAAYEAIIRDVSTTGFAVVCSSTVTFRSGQLVHVILNDQLEEPEGLKKQYSFELNGLVARIQNLGNGQVLYGCRLNRHLVGLEAYIMKKEKNRSKK